VKWEDRRNPLQKRTLYLFTLLELIWFGALWRSAEFGLLNVDEPFYLTAGDLVFRGQVPYRDFAFTQGPVLPYVYGAALALIGTNLATGRFVSVALSALALALVLSIAHRLASVRASVIAFILLIATPHVLYFLAIIKTYSLSAALTLWALAVVLHSGSPRSASWSFLSTLVAGLAALTRLSFLPVLVMVFLFWLRRRRGRASGLGLLVLGLLTLALAVSSNGNLIFDVLQFHLSRARLEGAALSSLPSLALTTSIVFAPALVWVVFLLMLWWRVPSFQSGLVEWWHSKTDTKVLVLLVAMSLAIVHFLQPAVYWEYQIPGYFLAVVLVAAMSATVIDAKAQPVRTIILTISLVASSVGLWDRVSPALWRPTSMLVSSSEASELLARRGTQRDTLLGGFNHLALASGLQVFPGNEMGWFSLADRSLIPESTTRHLLSEEAVTDALASCSATFVATDPVALFPVTVPSLARVSEVTQKQWRDLLQQNYRIIYVDDRTIYADGGIAVFERVEEQCRNVSH
jgi:4-amino-4-deoxy-L-arabinose transferase-like glycosyltransferase